MFKSPQRRKNNDLHSDWIAKTPKKYTYNIVLIKAYNYNIVKLENDDHGHMRKI